MSHLLGIYIAMDFRGEMPPSLLATSISVKLCASMESGQVELEFCWDVVNRWRWAWPQITPFPQALHNPPPDVIDWDLQGPTKKGVGWVVRGLKS